MRLWSFAPEYLDSRGLVALWREALLAQKVLAGETVGYRNHPQLERFRAASEPLDAIGAYLDDVWREATRRGYRFDRTKIRRAPKTNEKEKTKSKTKTEIDARSKAKSRDVFKIFVSTGQLEYERRRFLEKAKLRAPDVFEARRTEPSFRICDAFVLVPGPVASWERRPRDVEFDAARTRSRR